MPAPPNIVASGAPLVSVVIASVNGEPSILECLQALVDQQTTVSYEVLVVDCCGEKLRSLIRRKFLQPEIQIIGCEQRLSIPRLRAIGMSKAKGKMVAVLEDHCNVAPGWFEAIVRAHQAGVSAVAGPVENGSADRVVDWAVFFCEYSPFMAPLIRGSTEHIPGNNVAYDQKLLHLMLPLLQAELWESFIHQKLKESGVRFFCDPEMIVYHKKSFRFSYFMKQRYHYSRSFAGMRLTTSPWWKRLAYACSTPLLLPILSVRIAKTVKEKGCHTKEFVRSIPAIGMFLVSWAIGEAVGAMWGAGNSLVQVE
jgi:glycosyltransferase involved in cell wall biosynthesis